MDFEDKLLNIGIHKFIKNFIKENIKSGKTGFFFNNPCDKSCNHEKENKQCKLNEDQGPKE